MNKMSNEFPRVLIISALPITKSSSTRAFYTYFKLFPNENIGQIYTNPNGLPDPNFCKFSFCLSDKEILRKWFSRKRKKQQNSSSSTKTNDKVFNFGKKNYAIVDLLRSFLWKKSKFFNSDLKEWINEFKPEIIFYHNSHALFMPKLLKCIEEYTKKPMIIEVSDDYYFEYYKSPLLFSSIRRKLYRKRFRDVIARSRGQFYVSEKMRTKYNEYFGKSGEVIYISSTCVFDKPNEHLKDLKIGYFGNTGLGRDESINLIEKTMEKSGQKFNIDVYSPDFGHKGKIKISDNLALKGFVPYEQMIKLIPNYNILLFVESFSKKMLRMTKYSLSTKVSDYLYSNIPILAYGPIDSGSISFLLENKCAYVACSKKELENVINRAINHFDDDFYLKNADIVSHNIYNSEQNAKKSYDIILRCAEMFKGGNK